MVSIFEQISPFLVGAVGALLTYFFTSRHERIKVEKARATERKELAVVLIAELTGLHEALSARIDSMTNLFETKQTGGSQIFVNELGELYRAHLGRLGLLGVDVIGVVVSAYKTAGTIPKTVKVVSNSSGTRIADYDTFTCVHGSPAFISILEGHKKILTKVNDAISQLQIVSRGKT